MLRTLSSFWGLLGFSAVFVVSGSASTVAEDVLSANSTESSADLMAQSGPTKFLQLSARPSFSIDLPAEEEKVEEEKAKAEEETPPPAFPPSLRISVHFPLPPEEGKGEALVKKGGEMAPAIRVALPPELSPPERLPPHLTASGEPMMDESRLAMAMDWTLYPARGPLTTDVALNYIGQVLRPDKAEAIAPVSVETIIVEPDIQEITDSEIAASEIAASEIPVHEQSDGAIMAALETTPDGVSEAALGEPSVVSVPLASVFISPVAAQLDPSLIQVAALPSPLLLPPPLPCQRPIRKLPRRPRRIRLARGPTRILIP